jgi:type VI secretion system secreted protein VgrG
MLHETGHLWSEALWSDPANKQDWRDAIESDGQAPSEYARNNMTEDFAESANMYWSAKGRHARRKGASAIVLDTNTSTGLRSDV